MQSTPMVRFSEFLGIGYFGDENQDVIAPIFDSRHNAERGWARVTDNKQAFHVVFVEQESKYEFVAYPLKMETGRINYVIYRSFSSVGSLHKFRETHSGRTFIKFGWHDMTKPEKFDVMASYVKVDSVEFVAPSDIKKGTLVDRIRKNEL